MDAIPWLAWLVPRAHALQLSSHELLLDNHTLYLTWVKAMELVSLGTERDVEYIVATRSTFENFRELAYAARTRSCRSVRHVIVKG